MRSRDCARYALLLVGLDAGLTRALHPAKKVPPTPDVVLPDVPEYLWMGSHVHVVTVDTRSNRSHRMAGPPGWDTYVLNIGAGRGWHDFKTKMEIMRDWLEARPMPANDTVVFVDGDVMYGGCSVGEFDLRLRRTLEVTGARVVFGAETQCNDYNGDCDGGYPERYYEAVLNEFSLTKETMRRYTNSTRELIRQCDKARSPIKCLARHELKFLNSGLYAGHAANLLHFLREWLLVMEDGWPNATNVKLGKYDQSGALLLLEQNQDLVTLDYGTMLFNNLYGVNLVLDNTTLYDYKPDKKVWFNNLIQKDVCFFHPNGNHAALSFFDQEFTNRAP